MRNSGGNSIFEVLFFFQFFNPGCYFHTCVDITCQYFCPDISLIHLDHHISSYLKTELMAVPEFGLAHQVMEG